MLSCSNSNRSCAGSTLQLSFAIIYYDSKLSAFQTSG